MVRFNSFLSVLILKVIPVDSSLFEIIVSHDAKDSLCARLCDRLDILMTGRISSESDTGFSDLTVSEKTQKVSVSFLNISVDDIDLIGVSPVRRPFKTESSLIIVSIENLEFSFWESFHLVLTFHFALSGEIVVICVSISICFPNSINTSLNVWHLHGDLVWRTVITIFWDHPF